MPPLLTSVPGDLIPVIGYIRVSMAREEMISPEIQKATVSSWAARTGRRIIDWVIDLDMSGRNFRRKVMKAIERIEAREAAEIAVYRYDRWGRNAVESLANCRRVEMVGGQLNSATEPFDIETGIGRYSRTNAFAIAEMQSDQISDNWKAALNNRVERGIPAAGNARFGYVRLGRVLDPYAGDRFRYRRDPNDAKGERYEPDYASGLADVHLEMYDQHIADTGFMSIATWLNSRGIGNTRGAQWSDVTVRNVLDSGFAAGWLRVHDPECPCRKPSSCVKRIYVPGAQPAILDEATWEEYRKVRQERTKRAPRARYPAYPLAGLIRCGHCHSPMKIQSGGHPTTPGYGYRCSRWHHYRDCDGPFPRRVVVEKQMLAQLGQWSGDIESRAAVTAARKTARIAAVTDRQRLETALADKDAALQRLAVQRAVDGDRMPDAVYEAARDELLTARATTERALAQTQATAEICEEDALPLIVDLVEGWDVLPVAARTKLLGKLIRHVKVSRGEGEAKELRVVVTPLWEACSCPPCGLDVAVA